MAGMEADTPIPEIIRLHKQSRVLELGYGDATYRLPFEYLRVMTPSAEARGHGPGQEVLQVGKRNVELLDIQPAGTYALKLVFSDGHDSGLYTWDLLYNLAVHQEALWAEYLRLVEARGASRDSGGEDAGAPRAPSCGHHH